MSRSRAPAKPPAAALAVALAVASPLPGAASQAGAQEPPTAPAGVLNLQRAWQDWTLNCQGCHVDGQGAASTPRLIGTVARFLSVPGGREYLGRVPGVATSPLPDADLAEVMNWMLWRFDKEHLPAGFAPYDAAEIARLRTQPLRLEASQVRAQLLQKADSPGTP